uniref:Gap junction protein n=1 Tax=Sphaeramia orbicularis TaxID=375764 RepID=A0A673AT79_9TELE
NCTFHILLFYDVCLILKNNHSTVIGKIWLTMLLIFRILLVALVGDAVYSDEQSKFTCNTQQPGCNNVCYDTFAPVSHLRFWVFQIVLVSTPSIFYIDYGELGEDPTHQSNQVLLIYILHVLLRSVMEITFLVGQYFLFGFEVPHLYRCDTYPCPTRTDCFVSRATEKTIFLNFMFSISLGCFVLNIAECFFSNRGLGYKTIMTRQDVVLCTSQHLLGISFIFAQ